ncbi:MAG TPA: SLBB domain-containing protein [Bacteroidota bacterium]|nr:SLBB domain-containing protein [Bacteroidota bacterium]
MERPAHGNDMLGKHFVKIGLVLSLHVLVSPFALSQTSRGQTDEQERKDRLKLPSVAVPTTRPILDAPLNPAKYFVGPSDVIAVSIWAPEPLYLSLIVSPEGKLVIPTVAEVHVAGLTLAEARKKIIAEIGKKYLSSDATVTLLQPREIYVSVSGNVRVPGSYTLYGSDRVEKAILEASKEAPQVVAPETEHQKLQQAETERKLKRASKRNIILKHRDGTAGRVDLQKFHATQDDRWNPYLKEGDEVFIPLADNPARVIGVYGAVNQPDRYEFADGDSFLGAIHLAYGFKASAIMDSVELTRYDEAQTELKTTKINAKAILDGRSPDIPLQPGDRIIVKAREEFREDYRVTVEGEVRYPGTYPITRNTTRLSEVLERAGGATPFAALTSAIIIRKSMEPEDISRERLMSIRGNVLREDTLSIVPETEIRMVQGEYVETDFEKLLRQRDSTQDVVLQPEDRVVIPSVKKTVYVFGQVVAPTHVPLVPGEDVAYYVKKAGGFTDRARTGDVVIIKRATRQWLAPSETTIEDGDYIWAPKAPDRPFSYYLAIIGQTASIISGALTIVLLVLQLQK